MRSEREMSRRALLRTWVLGAVAGGLTAVVAAFQGPVRAAGAVWRRGRAGVLPEIPRKRFDPDELEPSDDELVG